jgi:hypothetical protein
MNIGRGNLNQKSNSFQNPKSSQTYLKFLAHETERKNYDSRKGAKAAKVRRTE